MQKFFIIVGVIVVAWILISIIGSIVGFLFHWLIWPAIIIGIAYIAVTLVMKKKGVGKR